MTVNPEFTEWHKSSHSGGNNECVEHRVGKVAGGGSRHEVRDTKNRNGATLTFSGEQWAAFLNQAATRQPSA